MEYPLFVATENARAELSRFPEGGLTNTTQLLPILARGFCERFREISRIIEKIKTRANAFNFRDDSRNFEKPAAKT